MLIDGLNIDDLNIPKHIAIIMDGNRRWAFKKFISYVDGHKKGIANAMDIVRTCHEIDVKFLSLYAFSKENWKRSKAEINSLFELFTFFYNTKFEEIRNSNIKVVHSGDFEGLSDAIKNIFCEMTDSTSSNTGMVLNLVINYSGRMEIIYAVKSIFKDIISSDDNSLDNLMDKINCIDENSFLKYLYNPDIPFPDFLIRTSGEIRISNLFLWQIAYTELYFTSILWPDFNRIHFLQSIMEYQKRKRRFGGNL